MNFWAKQLPPRLKPLVDKPDLRSRLTLIGRCRKTVSVPISPTSVLSWPPAARSVATKPEQISQMDSSSCVVDPPRISTLPVVGTDAVFPIRRVYCVGKNYRAHVVEMGGDVERSRPVFFTKPSFGGVLYAGAPTASLGLPDATPTAKASATPVRYPSQTDNLHYEVELVVAIGKDLPSPTGGVSITPRDLLECVYGYAVGIDLTRRDLQGIAKKGGLPWDVAKHFDESAPMGPITPRHTLPRTRDNLNEEEDPFASELDDKHMRLTVNGETRQSVCLEAMIWKVPEIITELSRSFALKPGDLIMTGTPSGVGPVLPGDRLVGTIDGLVHPVDMKLV